MEKNKNLFLDVEENPKKVSEWLLFAFQHILAMLVACITVPMLTGLPIAATIVAAGIGTIIYIFLTKQKSPVFLSSSFAYISPMISALSIGLIGKAGGMNYMAVIIGMVLVGVVYTIVALIISKVGTAWINKLLPPVIVGPIIMVIGLGLAGSAVSNITAASGSGSGYNLIALLCGLIALFAIAIASHYGEGKMLGLIPFVVGMGCGYLSAVLFTLIGYKACNNEYFNIVNFSALENIFNNFNFASIFNYNLFVPNHAESFIFLRFDEIAKFDWATIVQVILLFVPVSLVTMCEHIGDHKNLGNIIGRDLLNEEPGMSRTLAGDGIATAVSGVICGAANTTYGENVAVIGTTKIASVKVVLLAAIFSIIVGFFTPFTALLQTIPQCVCGGVSLVLYGFIAASGIKMVIEEKIDFGKSKNIFIASVILVAGIGGLTLKLFPETDALGLTTYGMTITSIAVAMILGILLNVILKDKKEETPVNEAEAEAVEALEVKEEDTKEESTETLEDTKEEKEE